MPGGQLTPLPLEFIRQFADSMDQDNKFDTTADRMAYLSSPRRYAGQIVSDKEEDGAVYVLNTARDAWNPVGANNLVIGLGSKTFNVTFDGSAGAGQVGSLTIPATDVPSNAFIAFAFIDVGDGLVSVDNTSYLTLGIAVDKPDAALDASSGMVDALNNNIVTGILFPDYTKATTLRQLVMDVHGSDITSGSVRVIIVLTDKIINEGAGGGSDISLETNDITNSRQDRLDLMDSDTVTFEYLGDGKVTAHGSSETTVVTDNTLSVTLDGDGTIPTPITADVNLSTAANQGIFELPDGLFTLGFVQNGLLSGGLVTWSGTGYIYEVSPAFYVLNNVLYQTPAYTVEASNPITLSAPDGTFDRIDVFYVDNTSTVQVLEGTPTSTPVAPSLSAGQIQLSFALVETGTTQNPPDQEIIYQEDLGSPTEWDAVTSSGGRIVLNSINTPPQGTVSIEATLSQNGDTVTITKTSPITIDNLSVLTFKFQPKAYTGNKNQKKLRLSLRIGSTLVGNVVNLVNGSYGYSITNTGIQTISIPVSDFGVTTASSIDNLLILNISNGTNKYGFFLDNIQMQGVVISTPPPTAGRFGIEDITGVQDRLVDMENHSLTLNNLSLVSLNTPDYSSSLVIQANSASMTGSEVGNANNANIAVTGGVGNVDISISTNDQDGNGVALDITSTQATIGEQIAGGSQRLLQFTFGGLADGDTQYLPVSVNNTFADSNGNITIAGGGVTYTSYTRDYVFDITFDGGAGTGAEGAVDIPTDLFVKNGWFIEEVLVDIVDPIVDDSGTTYFELTTNTGNFGLNSTTGLTATLNTDINTKIELADLTTSIDDTDILALQIGSGNITAGRARFLVRVTNYVEAIGGGSTGGGGGNTIYTADDDIVDDRTVNLNGKLLKFSQDGNFFIGAFPVAGSESSAIQSVGSENPSAEVGAFFTSNTGDGYFFEITAQLSGTTASLVGRSEAGVATIDYTANTHTFNGLLQASNYGTGANTGTPTFIPAFDADGNVIEVAAVPTFQETLLALTGSLLTQNNTIDADGHSFTIDNIGSIGYLHSNDGSISLATSNTSTGGASVFETDLTGIQTSFFDGTGAEYAIKINDVSFIRMLVDDAATNSVTTGFNLTHHSLSTVSNGFGVGMGFELETDNGNFRTANSIISKWTDATDATNTSEFIIQGSLNNTPQNLLIISGAGIFTLTQGLQNFANNAAAISGGLTTGQLYRNGDAVNIVH